MKASPNPRPGKPERDQLRREQIADAARRCVRRHGFHRASMAQVAQEAGMSVGQIYRYFVNKEAIIEFIVGQRLSSSLAWMAGKGGPDDALKSLLAWRSNEVGTDERALLLEIQAEAARNPAVAAIVRAADARLHAQVVNVVLAQHPGMLRDDAAARVEMMATLTEGDIFRGGLRTDIDPQRLIVLYQEVVRQLFGAGQPHG